MEYLLTFLGGAAINVGLTIYLWFRVEEVASEDAQRRRRLVDSLKTIIDERRLNA